METINLFLAIAEIAGVFVGFGALISVTRSSEIEISQLGRIRAVVTIGLLVIIAALIPVILSNYGLNGHDLWVISSLVFLILNWAGIILSLRRPENRMLMKTQSRESPLMTVLFWFLLEIPVQLPLVLILIGLWSELEPAFYTTALVFNLFEAAFVLVQLVYAQVNPTSE